MVTVGVDPRVKGTERLLDWTSGFPLAYMNLLAMLSWDWVAAGMLGRFSRLLPLA